MIPGSFEYHRPGTVADAVSLLADHGDEGVVLAGGQSLINMMKMRLAAPSHLIDLQDIAELKGITDDGDHLLIGPMTTQADIIASAILSSCSPISASVSQWAGHTATRSAPAFRKASIWSLLVSVG